MLQQHSRQDDKYLWLYIVTTTIIPILFWGYFANNFFKIHSDHFWKSYFNSFLMTFTIPVIPLVIIYISSFILVLMICIFLYKYHQTNFTGNKYIRLTRGKPLVSPIKLRLKTKKFTTHQFNFCGIPIPNRLKNLHFSIVGSTGTGKSQAIKKFVASALQMPRIRVIAVDPNSDLFSIFYQPGDVILNPFDQRTAKWTIMNEIREDYDCERMAKTLIPYSPEPSHESFNQMTRVLITDLLAIMCDDEWDGPKTNKEFLRILIDLDNEKTQKIFEGMVSYTFFMSGETFGSIKAVLTQYISPLKYLEDGDFSIRDFIEHKSGNIYITWREDQLSTLRPLISCWADIICTAMLSLQNPKYDYLICLDELDSLYALNNLNDLVTKGRKHKVTVLAGIQAYPQLTKNYGVEQAQTLRNSFSTFACCASNAQDTITPQQLSMAFGDIEVERWSRTKDRNNRRSIVTEIDRLIRPVEISAMKPLEFYVSLAGNYPITKTRLKPVNYKTTIPKEIKKTTRAMKRFKTKKPMDVDDFLNEIEI